MKVLNEDPNRKLFQEKIKNSDELIFVFPIWWGNMPAIMKNFFDTNFEAGFAYKFQK
jgi:NAD(P)H dehydrogenase (quinone)